MHVNLWMADEDNSGPERPVFSVNFERIKRILAPIDDAIDAAVKKLCTGNHRSPHFVVTWIAAFVGSSLILMMFFIVSLLSNAVPFAFFLDILLSQPASVKTFAGIFVPFCWCALLGIVSHNETISLCDATSRGVRLTLYVFVPLYLFVWWAT